MRMQIGRIKHFFAGRDNEDVTVEVTWFYRPEEAVGGRKVRWRRATACMHACAQQGDRLEQSMRAQYAPALNRHVHAYACIK